MLGRISRTIGLLSLLFSMTGLLLGAVGCSSKNPPANLNNNSNTSGPSPITSVAITGQLIARTIVVGESLADGDFCVIASGDQLVYQWFKDGSPFAGSYGACLLINNAQISDSGIYKVRVSIAGAASSAAESLGARLTVQTTAPAVNPAVITANLQNKTVTVGDDLTGFCVTATGSNLAYQWFHNSSPIAGATTKCYNKTNVQTSDGGLYFVRLTTSLNGASAVKDSATATLTVSTSTVQPATITAQPPNRTLNVGENLTGLCVTATGTNLTYQWYKNGNALSGATANCFNKNNAQTTDSGTYFVRLKTTNGSASTTKDSNNASVTVNQPSVAPAVITANLQAKTVTEGNALSGFCVTATGSNLTYQWFKNGAPVTGATASCFNKASVQLSDAGNYFVLLTTSANGAHATKESATVALTVNPKPAPISCTYSMGGQSAINFGSTLVETIQCANVPSTATIELLGTKDGNAQGPWTITLSAGKWTRSTVMSQESMVGKYIRHVDVLSSSGNLLFQTLDVTVTVRPPANCTFALYSNLNPTTPKSVAIAHKATKLFYNCTSAHYDGYCNAFETVNVTCNNGEMTKVNTSGNSCLVVNGWDDSYYVPHGGLKGSCLGDDYVSQQCVNGTLGAAEIFTPRGCWSGG